MFELILGVNSSCSSSHLLWQYGPNPSGGTQTTFILLRPLLIKDLRSTKFLINSTQWNVCFRRLSHFLLILWWVRVSTNFVQFFLTCSLIFTVKNLNNVRESQWLYESASNNSRPLTRPGCSFSPLSNHIVNSPSCLILCRIRLKLITYGTVYYRVASSPWLPIQRENGYVWCD